MGVCWPAVALLKWGGDRHDCDPPFENEECVCEGRAVMSCAVCMQSCLVVNLQTLTSTLRSVLIVLLWLDFNSNLFA